MGRVDEAGRHAPEEEPSPRGKPAGPYDYEVVRVPFEIGQQGLEHLPVERHRLGGTGPTGEGLLPFFLEQRRHGSPIFADGDEGLEPRYRFAVRRGPHRDDREGGVEVSRNLRRDLNRPTSMHRAVESDQNSFEHRSDRSRIHGGSIQHAGTTSWAESHRGSRCSRGPSVAPGSASVDAHVP